MTDITRDRSFDEGGPAGPPQDPAEPGARLRELRDESQALLASGADAIRRQLSRNSHRFLEASRQRGGQ